MIDPPPIAHFSLVQFISIRSVCLRNDKVYGILRMDSYNSTPFCHKVMLMALSNMQYKKTPTQNLNTNVRN